MGVAGTAVLALLACLIAAMPAGAVKNDKTLYEGDSIYHHITIREDSGERCMIFGRQRDLRQTCIDLAKPDISVFEYSLTDGGIVIQNLFCDNRMYDAQIATFQAVFKRVFLFEGQRSGSCIIVASDRPACEPAGLRKQAEKWGGKIGRIDLIAESGKCRVSLILKNDPILTDDFNPANLLLMQKK